MTTLLLGATGQIGHALRSELAPLNPVVAPTSAELDLRSPRAIRDAIRRVTPTLVVNAAGYTNVDAAESEPELARILNADAPRVMAEECRAIDACFVHFSTDYVFDGTKQTPYVETDEPRPLNTYGCSKLDGEKGVAEVGGAFLIFRTSWVYAARGKNFALTMLRLAHERQELAVVNDQVGAPTSAAAIASGVVQVLRVLGPREDTVTAAAGIYHMTASGSATWFDFAQRILTDDPRADSQTARTLRPITTAEYATAARRPAYSLLDNTKLADRFGVRLPSWEAQWADVAEELRVSAG